MRIGMTWRVMATERVAAREVARKRRDAARCVDEAQSDQVGDTNQRGDAGDATIVLGEGRGQPVVACRKDTSAKEEHCPRGAKGTSTG